MGANNKIPSILVVNSDINSGIPAAGGTIDDLNNLAGVADGKYLVVTSPFGGITYNQSVVTPASGVHTRPTEFVIAIAEVVGEVLVSLEQTPVIRVRDLADYSLRAHTAGRSQKQLVKMSKLAQCGKEYGLRFYIENSEIYQRQGTNQYTRSYFAKADCCDTCTDCSPTDMIPIFMKFRDAINADVAFSFLTSRIVATGAIAQDLDGDTSADLSKAYTAGEVISDADLAIIIAYNKSLTDSAEWVQAVGLEVESTPNLLEEYCSINLKFKKLLGTSITGTFIQGFECGGTIETTQELAYEQGSSAQIRQHEYEAGGYKNNPDIYRVYEFGVNKPIEYATIKGAKYNELILTTMANGVMPGVQDQNWGVNRIALDAADNTVENDLIGLLDLLVAARGFDPLAPAAAAANTDPEVVEESPADPDADGIQNDPPA